MNSINNSQAIQSKATANVFVGFFDKIELLDWLLNFLLISMVFMSSVAIIYTTNVFRTTLNDLEIAEQHRDAEIIRHGQLLLEQSSLASPARVKKHAINHLGMQLPVHQQLHVLRIQ